ncbi:MAG: 2OG-Fe(II) oxygenase, partial [Alphaproteobacteria bacterium]
MAGVLRPLDRDAIRAEYRAAKPFPFFKIENFLLPDFLARVVAAYPSYETARTMGREFTAVNERLKIQVTDREQFPDPVKQLADELNGPEFLADMEYITDIPNLLADTAFGGGGMHLSSSGGRLDVHVDFNFLDRMQTFRRLNILVYLNPEWQEDWGGRIELWDKDVTRAEHSFAPVVNRCVVFETSEMSYHGVTPLTCPPGVVRKSFAAYYYTKEAPAWYDGQNHST